MRRFTASVPRQSICTSFWRSIVWTEAAPRATDISPVNVEIITTRWCPVINRHLLFLKVIYLRHLGLHYTDKQKQLSSYRPPHVNRFTAVLSSQPSLRLPQATLNTAHWTVLQSRLQSWFTEYAVLAAQELKQVSLQQLRPLAKPFLFLDGASCLFGVGTPTPLGKRKVTKQDINAFRSSRVETGEVVGQATEKHQAAKEEVTNFLEVSIYL